MLVEVVGKKLRWGECNNELGRGLFVQVLLAGGGRAEVYFPCQDASAFTESSRRRFWAMTRTETSALSKSKSRMLVTL